MNTKKMIPLMVGLLAMLVVLSGCVQNTPPQTGGELKPVPTVDSGNAPSGTPSQIAEDLSGGTGAASEDITSGDLDDLQADIDNLEIDVDNAAQSDI